MKIAYIYTALTTLGGADKILTVKANYMADVLKWEVYFITDSQCGQPPVFPLSPHVRHIDLGLNFHEQYSRPTLLARYLCYRKLMKQYRQRLTALLCDLRCDVVCTTCGREMDFLTSIPDGSRKVGESHIARPFMRNLHLMEQRGFPHNFVARYWRRRQENAIKKLDALVVLTAHDAESWASVCPATVIPNPNTLPHATKVHATAGGATNESDTTDKSDAEGNVTPRHHTILSIGRLDEQKGYDMLIDAWSLIAKRHPQWRVDIYGIGVLHDALEAQAIQRGVADSLTFCGPTSDVARCYHNSDFYVMSSRFEGFGLVLAEAMSCGLPCISFDCPYGPSEVIRHGEDGLLVPNGDVAALAQTIERLIDDEPLRRRLGHKAKENIQRYAIDRVMQQWQQLFDDLTRTH